MSDSSPGTARFAAKYGLYTAVASIIFYWAEIITGQYRMIDWLSNVILIVGIVFAIREYKQASGGYMTYGQGVGMGAMLSAIAGLGVGFFFLIYLSFDPSIIQQDLELQTRMYEEMGDQWGWSDEEIDQMTDQLRMFLRPSSYFLNYVITYGVFGTICSLIISIFMRKKKDPFAE